MICPFCGHDNLAGMDRCEECMHSFRDLDVPQPMEGLQKHIMEDSVRVLDLAHPVNMPADESVARAIDQMKQHRVGCALVLEGGKLVGIFTERDILFKLAGRDYDLERVTMRQLMTGDPAKLKVEDTIATALNKMSVGGFRHLPVVSDDGAPVGVVSIKDILGYLCRQVVYPSAAGSTNPK